MPFTSTALPVYIGLPSPQARRIILSFWGSAFQISDKRDVIRDRIGLDSCPLFCYTIVEIIEWRSEMINFGHETEELYREEGELAKV